MLLVGDYVICGSVCDYSGNEVIGLCDLKIMLLF